MSSSLSRLPLLCCVLRSHFRLTGIVRRFLQLFDASLLAHIFQRKILLLKASIGLMTSYWPCFLGTQVYSLKPVFLGFPVLLDLRKFKELSSTELPCDPKMAGRIFRLKSNHQIPIESLFSSSLQPLSPPTRLWLFFLTDSYPTTIVSSSQTQLISD